MADLPLTLALSDNARTRPILDGRVNPDGVRFSPTMLHPSEMFWRQLKFEAFDVSEMSISSFLISLSRGRKSWVALPVFTTRRVFHTTILVRADPGIERPADLAGKRVGVPEYQQTWAVWSRGVLLEEFGVRPEDITWFMERGEDHSHGATTGFTPPPGVTIHQIPPTSDIGRMMLDGELDATLLYLNAPNLVDRSVADLSKSPLIRTLFPDPAAEARRYYRKTGVYPINHLLVVRRSLFEAQPWIGPAIYAAFAEAKAIADATFRAELAPFHDLGLVEALSPADFSADPMAYGVAANRTVIETVARYVHEQGLADRRMAIEEIFAPNILGT